MSYAGAGKAIGVSYRDDVRRCACWRRGVAKAKGAASSGAAGIDAALLLAPGAALLALSYHWLC